MCFCKNPILSMRRNWVPPHSRQIKGLEVPLTTVPRYQRASRIATPPSFQAFSNWEEIKTVGMFDEQDGSCQESSTCLDFCFDFKAAYNELGKQRPGHVHAPDPWMHSFYVGYALRILPFTSSSDCNSEMLTAEMATLFFSARYAAVPAASPRAMNTGSTRNEEKAM